MVGRIINMVNKNTDPTKTHYSSCQAICYESFGERSYLRAQFKIDKTTSGMIFKIIPKTSKK